jgi:hypothetical protein
MDLETFDGEIRLRKAGPEEAGRKTPRGSF